jgi:hypothetical protein
MFWPPFVNVIRILNLIDDWQMSVLSKMLGECL